ncbi:MAG: hypothetical protein Q9164_006692, partial [Protoblastenia rupestris]
TPNTSHTSSKAAELSDETKSTKSNVLKIPKDPHSIGQALKQHGLLQNNSALQKYPEFEQLVRDIINDERFSAMKKKQLQEFEKVSRNVERLGEDTFVGSLLPLIIKRKYTDIRDMSDQEAAEIAKKLDSLEGSKREAMQKEYLYTTKLWIDDGLFTTINSEFRRTLLPNKYSDYLGFEAELAKLMAKREGMKNPKPDFTYGVLPDCFPTKSNVMLSPETRTILEISPALYHPFLLIEGKAERGSMAEAQNQACRGGATVVNAERILREKTGQLVRQGVDETTAIFSATIAPGLMEIWVHWAEIIGKDDILLHMNRLASKALNDEEHVVSLRRILHNILQWGCTTRRADLNTFHEKLNEHQKAENEQQREEANKKRKLSGGTPKSKGCAG